MTLFRPAQDSLPALNLAETEPARSGELTLVLCPDAGLARQWHSDLQFLLGTDRCHFFPDWESLPYDRLPVSGRLIAQRLRVLNDLQHGWRGLLLTTPASLLQRLPPPHWLASNAFSLRCGDRVSPETLLQRLTRASYKRTDSVEAPGELAFRGAVLDFFPTGWAHPLRVEFLDDEIDSMRWFDPATQRSTERCDQVKFFAGREFSLRAADIDGFRHRFRAAFDTDETRCSLFNEVVAGTPPPGAEYFLDLLFDHTALLPDHLPQGEGAPRPTLIRMPGARKALNSLHDLAAERYRLLCHDPDYPLLPPQRLFADWRQISARLTPTSLKDLPGGTSWRPLGGRTPSDVRTLVQQLARPGRRLLLCAPSEGALAEMQGSAPIAEGLLTTSVQPRHGSWSDFAAASAERGTALAALRCCARRRQPDGAELVLFGWGTAGVGSADEVQRRPSTTAAPAEQEPAANPLADLRPGDLVVHRDRGLGRYRGLKTLTLGGLTQEFATLEYRNGALLRLPIDQFHLLTRYPQPPDADPALDELGSQRFQRARKKAQQQARDDAAELLSLYAAREARGAKPLPVADEAFDEFCRQFPFRQTEDQRRLTAQIRQKLAGREARSMLICGDVGFGKTELAMRAAFIAASAGRQCCLLVPTTLLCRQHHERFRERFAAWNLSVARLDSSVSAGDCDRLRQRLKDGEVQLLISTHRVLRGNNWRLPRLGLVIVDEEHRFGVSDKERIRSLGIGVHAISMTATPIPRTLNQCLSRVNDIAIMHRPPEERLPVQTFVRTWRDELVREALRREQVRGGQSFVVHDRIADIEDQTERLRELLPDLRFATAHGRMSARQLQHVMERYDNGDIDVLVSTTIVESGIDVPNANTLLVTRSDRLGLAQLHQLRGRVGRSDRQAWCWFLYPEELRLAARARHRLQALERAQGPGTGLLLAQEDLDQRGGGELLGREQSGHSARIGLELYTSMLNEAIRDIQAGKGAQREQQAVGCEVDLGDAALIPQQLIEAPWTRAQYYHRISAAQSAEALQNLQDELTDRFGPLSAEVRHLLRNARLRLQAQQRGITRIWVHEQECALEVRDGSLDPQKVVALVRRDPSFHLTPKSLRVRLQAGGAEQTVRWIFDRLDSILEPQLAANA